MNWFITVIFAMLEVALRSLANAYTNRFVGNSREIGSQLVGLGERKTSVAKPCLAVALSIVLIMCFTSLVMTVSAAPGDPGHPASSISAGTFEAGDFIFQNKLNVSGNFTVGTNTLFVDTGAGRVGIGTASPSTGVLDIGGANGDVWLSGTTPLIRSGSSLSISVDTDLALGGGSTDTITVGRTDQDAPMTIRGSTYLATLFGDVGIGTTSPSERLNVNGSLRVDNTTGDAMFFVNTSNRRVGIWTTTPSKRLEIFDNVQSGEIGSGGGIRITQNDLMTNRRLAINFKTYSTQNYGDVEIGAVKESTVGSEISGFYVATKESTAGPDERPIERFRIQSDGDVGIGTSSPSEKLTLAGGTLLQTTDNPTIAGSVTNAAYMTYTTSVYVSGKYAYVAARDNDSLVVIDISEPTSPTFVGGVINSTYMDGAYSVHVSGKYAYVLGRSSDSLAVVDISDSTNPTVVGGVINSTYMNEAYQIYVSGKYAYVAAGASDSLAVIDISDPTSPTVAGGVINTTYMNKAHSVYVSGKYAYVAAQDSHSLAVVDISEPTSPTVVSGVINSTDMGGPNSVYVSGKYAYVAAGDVDSLAVVDISDPTNPIFVDSVANSTYMDLAYSVYVSGKYAYVLGRSSNSTALVDISDPTSPTVVSGIINDTYLGLPYQIYVSGKYAYISGAESDNLAVMDISGIDVPSANIGDISASTIEVTENVDVGNNLYVRGGLNVGPGGILTDGRLSVSNISYFGDNVGIGTTTPDATLKIIGSNNQPVIHTVGGSGSDDITIESTGGNNANLVIKTSTSDPKIEFNIGDTDKFQFGVDDNDGDKLKISRGTALGTNDTIVIDSSGNVGINTTSPSNELEVVGTINATAIKVGTTNVCQYDGTNCPSGIANSSAWNKTGTNVFLANTGDYVGIGTTSPSYKLEVAEGTENAVNLSGILYVNDTSGNVGIGTESPEETLTIASTGGDQIQIYHNTNDAFIYTSYGDLVLTPAGNVGIGTSSPSYLFEVDSGTEDAVNLSGVLYVNDTSGNVGIGTNSPDYKLDVIGGQIRIGSSDTDSLVMLAGGRGFMGYRSASDAVILQTDSTKNLTFNIHDTWGSGEVMRIDTSGNVGVGTSNPQALMHILRWNSNAGLMIEAQGGDQDPMLSFTGNAPLEYWTLGMDDSDGDKFKIGRGQTLGTNDLITITEDGNVGIGTTTPTTKLDVNGSLNITDSSGRIRTPELCLDGDCREIWPAGGDGGAGWLNSSTQVYLADPADDLNVSDTLFVNSSGNKVGIGTTSPSYTLDVNGTARFDTLITPYNQTVIVAKSGGDFTSVQAAIDSITDASSTNRYSVLVMPGKYTEQITMKSWIDIRGVGGKRTAVLYFTGNDNGTVILADYVQLQDLRIEESDVASEWAIVGNDTQNVHIRNVDILGTGSKVSQGIKITGDTWLTLFIEHCVINYRGTTGYAIYLEGNSASPQNIDMHIADMQIDSLFATTGGSIYIKDTYAGRIRSSLLRTSSNGFNVKVEDTSAGTTDFLLDSTTLEYGTSSLEIGSGATVILKHSQVDSISNSGTLRSWGAGVGDSTQDFFVSDKIGIGTESPGEVIHAYTSSTSNEDAIVRIETDDSSETAGLEIASSADYWDIKMGAAGDDLIFNDGADRVTFEGGGNVGIGEVNPAYKLEVNGSLNVKDATGSTIFFVNQSDGNVGIGTTTPTTILNIHDDDYATFARISGEVGGTTYANIWGIFDNPAHSPNYYDGVHAFYGTGSNMPVGIRTNNIERVTVLNNTGYVGINTTSPIRSLHIMRENLSITSGAAHDLAVLVVEGRDAGVETFANDDDGSWASYYSLGTVSGGSLVDKWAIIRQTSNAGDGSLRFTYGTDNDQFQNTPMMTIQTDGDVGIGTTTPTTKLDVNGSLNITDSSGRIRTPQLCLDGSCRTTWPTGGGGSVSGTGSANHLAFWENSENITYDSDGNLYWNDTTNRLGIGAASPEAELHINKSGTPVFRIASADNNGNSELIIGESDATVSGIKLAYDGSANELNFRDMTSGAEGNDIMTVERAGEVGIGTTSPTAKLHINGTGALLSITNGTDSIVFVNESGFGSFGIRKANPWAPAHIKVFPAPKQLNYLFLEIEDASDGYGGVAFGDAGAGGGQDIKWGVGILADSYSTASLQNAFYVWQQFDKADSSVDAFRLVITDDGDIGIGTTSPTTKLDVNGSLNVNGNITMPTNFYIGNGASAPSTGAVAIGTNADATAQYATALGYGTDATANSATALGNLAQATGTESTALGVNTNASSSWTTALGYNADATGESATAVGKDTQATGESSVALGNYANATANYALALGTNADATAQYTIALGSTQASADFAVAIGEDARAKGSISVALGKDAQATNTSAIAIGEMSNATGEYATALGYGTDATAYYATALGRAAQATGSNALALGRNANATNTSTISLGYDSDATKEGAIAIGYLTGATGEYTTVLGYNADATGDSATALGRLAKATGLNSIAIGRYSQAAANYTIAIGEDANATDTYSISIGRGSDSKGYDSVALGRNAQATANDATALGSNAFAESQGATAVGYELRAENAGSIVIGYQTNATHDNSAAIGRQAATTAANQFMVGSSSYNLNTYIYGDLNVTSGKDICITGSNCLSTAGGGGGAGWATSGLYVYNDTVGVQVGIGTSSPNRLLHVGNGTDAGQSYTTILATNTGNTAITVRDSSNDVEVELAAYGGHGYMGTKTNDQLRFFTNDGYNDLVIDTDGDVGIGTTTPSYKFEVADGTENAVNLSGVLYINDTSGNVGIGTTGPAEKLDIFATAGADTKLRLSDADVTLPDYSISGSLGDVSQSNAVAQFETSFNFGVTGGIALYGFTGSGVDNGVPLSLIGQHGGTAPTKAAVAIYGQKHSGSNNRAALSGTEPILDVAAYAGNPPLFRIQANGNVGIGTSSPSAKLEVQGSGTGGLSLNVTSDLYVNDTSGRVGIGTASPGGLLDVYIPNDEEIYLGQSSVASVVQFTNGEIRSDSSLFRITGDARDGSNLNITLEPGTAGEVMRLTTSGLVGIGTTSPSEKLNVNGSLRVDNSTGSAVLFVNSTSGSVGIGTTDLEEKFIVQKGTVLLSQDAVNQFESGRIRFTEYTGGSSSRYQGAYLHYDGNANRFNIGVHDTLDTDASNDVNAITIERGSGEVGIGTGSPNRLLEINDTGDVYLRVTSDDDNIAGVELMRPGNSYYDWRMKDDGGALVFSYSDNDFTGESIIFKVTPTAVGLWDTSPDTAFEIVNSTTPQFRISHTDGIDYGDFAVDSDGNLTISSSSGNVIIQLG